MASTGPKSDAPTAAAKPAEKAFAKPAVNAVPAKAEPVKAAAPKPVVKPTPVAAKAPASVAAKPVSAPAPVAAKPAPAPVVPTPVAAKVAAPVVTPEVPKPAPAAAAAVIKKEVVAMETTIKSAAEKVQAQAKSLFGDVNDRTKTAMEKGSKMFEDMNEFSKGNVEALVESSKIAAKGVEAMGQEAAEYSRKQFETATAALKSLSSVKSPTEFFKLQSDYARSMFDSMVAETSKNTESMLKLAGEVAQPISNRVAVAAEKMKIAA